MTKTLTTISANNRPRPSTQVLLGSNNNIFIHSITNCKSKSLHFDFPLFLRTAIFFTLGTQLDDFPWYFVELWLVLKQSEFFEDFRISNGNVAKFTKHNMAKSPQLVLVITAFIAGFLLAECFAQRQICSYYGMNLLLSFTSIYFVFKEACFIIEDTSRADPHFRTF